MSISKITLPNEIRKIDDKAPSQLRQNFDEIIYKLNEVITALNSITTSTDSTDEYEANAITYQAGEPSD